MKKQMNNPETTILEPSNKEPKLIDIELTKDELEWLYDLWTEDMITELDEMEYNPL